MNDVLQEKMDIAPSFFNISSLIIDEDYFWFIANNFNGLFRIERASGKINLVGVIPNEGMFQRQLYFKGIKYNDYLVFTPALAKEIAIYDLKKDEFIKLPINPPRVYSPRWSPKRHQFFGITTYKKFVFVIGCFYPGIIRVNMDDFTMLYMDEWVEELEAMSLSKTMYFRQTAIVKEDKLYIPCCMSNVILMYDLETLDYKFHALDTRGACISDLYIENNIFWYSTRQGLILGRGVIEEDKLIQKEQYEMDIDEAENSREIIKCDNKVYVFLIHNQRLFLLNNQMQFVELQKHKVTSDAEEITRFQGYSFMHLLEDGMIYMDSENMQLVELENENIIATYSCTVDSDIYSEWLKEGYKVTGYTANGVKSLKEFLAFIEVK